MIEPTAADEVPFSRDRDLLALLVTDTIAAIVKGPLAEQRARCAEGLHPTERVAVPNPHTGRPLGFVTRVKDTTDAEIVDWPALYAHLAALDPDNVYEERIVKPGVTDTEVLDVLAAHAPHLLTTQVEARDTAVAKAIKDTLAGHAVPGVRLRTKPGHIRIQPADDRAEQVHALLATGHVTVAGHIATQP